ncbi:MAG TPA: VOC family protein [Candidatus Babeliales bacterium]|nr:VOC family protein [Candidatus Babeliales bacterium]
MRAAPPPFRIDGIEHVLLLVSGMDKALDFYQDALGARLESQFPKYAMAELRVGASHLDLVDILAPEGAWAAPPVAGGRNVDHIALRVGKCEETAFRRHLAAQAVEIVEERANEEPAGKSLSLYVRDPSGNTIELMASFSSSGESERSTSGDERRDAPR